MPLDDLEIYRHIFQQTRNPVCILSPDGLIDKANPAHHRLFKIGDKSPAGQSLANFMAEPDLAILLETVRTGDSFHRECILRCADASVLHADVMASGIYDAQDVLSAIMMIFRDQAQRRRKDQELQQFRTMVDQSNDAFFTVDAATSRILDANKRACERWGYSHEEVLQLRVIDLNPDYHDLSDWHDRVASIRHSGCSFFEARHQTRDGEIFPVEISHRYVETPEGDRIIAVLRDITERKAAEEHNRRAQLAWSRTFDSSPEIITIQDNDFRITHCNQATVEMFNQSRGDIIGQHCYALFRDQQSPCPGCPVPRAVALGQSITEEIEHRRLNKTFSVTVSPIHNDQGEIDGLAHFARDITEHKKLEAHLRQAQKMESIGNLAGGIAHDFNNILSAILGYTQIARMHIPASSKADQALEQVINGSERASDLVRQILAFSRKSEYRMAPVTIPGIIDEALHLLRPSLPRTIEVIQDIDRDAAPIIADAVQVHQVIMNLCTNAYHAMQEQRSGTLRIGLKKVVAPPDIVPDPPHEFQPEGYLLLSISDTGTGMDSATQEKIFDPYFTTKNPGEGTGLGLAVVHGIVRDFGGHIRVASEPGQGTCFSIYLPAAPQALSNLETSVDPAHIPMGSEHLLVIDDEEPIAELLKGMLERYGYRVTCTSDSLAALATFKRRPELFDLVITDYAMPQLDGISLAQELLELRNDLPVLLCTGFHDQRPHAKALQAGITDCLHKPVQAAQLARRVRRALDA